MKEHSLFLEAGFPCRDKDFIEEAGRFRRKFEELLKDAVRIADTHIQESVLNSGELVTEFTLPAEKRTMSLSGIPIDTRITEEIRQLSCGCFQNTDQPPSFHNTYSSILSIQSNSLRPFVSNSPTPYMQKLY